MKSSRHLLLSGVRIVLIGVAAWAISARSSFKTQPAENIVAAQRAPYDPNLVQQTLEFYALQARSDPQGATNRVFLARWYLERFRETGDIADARGAEQAARASLRLRLRNNGEAWMQLSRSLVAQHRFAEALKAANRSALYHRSAFRQCADIEIELGKYNEAQRDMAKAPFLAEDPAYLALRARLMEVRGHVAVELKLLQKAAQLADSNLDMPPQSVSWFHERLGHCLFQQGRLAEAEHSYREGLRVFPDDYRTMAALARLFAARGAWAQAAQWGQKAAAIVPAPETISLLGDAYLALRQPKKARAQYQLVEAIAGLSRAQGIVYDRQRALFYADHNRRLDEALQLARGELKFRRDIYSYDTLAWVLYKKGLFSEAQQAEKLALSWGTRDATLFYHAGLIAAALGQKTQARTYLKRALSYNPHFYPGAPQARAMLSRLDASPASVTTHSLPHSRN